MISSGKSSFTLDDVLRVASEAQIVSYYLGILKVPCIINSPLRQDRHPSFGLYSPNGTEINYIDFSTRDSGTIFTLLKNMWNLDYPEVFKRICQDFSKFNSKATVIKSSKCDITSQGSSSNIDMKCKVREWKDYDLEYWASYGITLPWLKYANVYPISHKIIVKDGREFVFGADKYAYAYVEFKEGKTTLKIYQPFNKRGFKWANKHDRSVISLWTKVPKTGDKIVVCSSLKDALCLWANTSIPAIAIQGEGYGISDTAINELKRRYKEVYILLDNDEAGLRDGEKLSASTGFINLVLPNINGAKDVSDLYKSLENKKRFKNIILNLFNNHQQNGNS